MTMLLELPSIFKSVGLDVIEMPGWRTRNATDGPFNPKGIMVHHDGMGLGWDNIAGNDLNVPKNMSKDATNGSQVWISRKGVAVIVAAGRMWHAGLGKGWGKIAKDRGNELTVGWETDHYPGNPWPKEQMDAIYESTRAAFKYYGWTTDYCAGHKEYAANRKTDPERFDLDAWRRALLEDDEMKATDRIMVRDGYYKGPVDRPISVEDALKTGVNYGSSALLQLAKANERISKLEELVKELMKK